MPRIAWACLLATLAGGSPVLAEERKNWFDDPFFQVSRAIVPCPEPRGPRITQEERRVQSHHRAERGTTCWLQGQCERPNAYAEDAAIAARIRAAFDGDASRRATTLWVTVQARIVYLEGCVRQPSQATALERFGRSVPGVQQAVALVYRPGRDRRPYPVFEKQGQ